MITNTKRLQIEISPEQHRYLKQLAARRGITLKHLILTAIAEQIKETK